MNTAAIPAELRDRPQWVAWMREERDPKPTKVPYRPTTTKTTKASTTDPETWGSHADAVAALEWADGIGYVFAEDDPFAGVDLDGCRDEAGVLAIEAAVAITRLASYTEWSISGNGVHIIIRGAVPATRRRVGGVEMYDRGRYFCMTGDHMPGTPATIEERQDELEAWHTELFPPAPPAERPHSNGVVLPDDRDLLDRAMAARNGAKFTDLWEGRWEGAYPSQSEADQALCSLLAFWTANDAARLDALFRQSGLMRAKWERADYRDRTLELVLGGQGYSGPTSTAAATKTASRGTSVVNVVYVVPPTDAWPDPLNDCVLYGLTKEIIKVMEPHTEADRAALLVQLLVGFGNLVGERRGYDINDRNDQSPPYFLAGADRHYPNLYGALVGDSSKGRKGSSWSLIRSMLHAVDADWADDRVMSGLSSGEGLIHAVRDATTTRIAVKEKGRVVGFDEYESDPGVADKRLLAMEPEFASVLRVATRDGNTVSTQIRQAFDTGKLGTMTKNNPTRATGAHVSIIGHITTDELRRELTRTDAANGFANRFLWVCVRRSKELPDGGEFHRVNIAPYVRALREAASTSRGIGRVDRDAEARELWHHVYHDLSTPGAGLAGAVTSRGEALTMRLALIYALLDSSPVIRRVHLEAALEVWRYCAASARFIWGTSTGDPIADELHQALVRAGSMTRTEMRDHFGRNQRAERVNAALQLLETSGLAERAENESTGGRPAEVWKPVRAEEASP